MAGALDVPVFLYGDADPDRRSLPDTRRDAFTRRAPDVGPPAPHARLGGIGVALEGELERITGYECRVTILGHVQRGGSPVAFDRVLATRFGVAAMDAVLGARFGAMVGLRGTQIVETPLAEAIAAEMGLPPDAITARAAARYVLEIPQFVGDEPDPRSALDAVFDLLEHGLSPHR